MSARTTSISAALLSNAHCSCSPCSVPSKCCNSAERAGTGPGCGCGAGGSATRQDLTTMTQVQPGVAQQGSSEAGAESARLTHSAHRTRVGSAPLERSRRTTGRLPPATATASGVTSRAGARKSMGQPASMASSTMASKSRRRRSSHGGTHVAARMWGMQRPTLVAKEGCMRGKCCGNRWIRALSYANGCVPSTIRCGHVSGHSPQRG